MQRRQFLIASAAALAGCSMFGTSGGDAQIQDTYQKSIAAMDAAGVLFNAGAALVTTGVLKPGSTAWQDVDAAFSAAAAALDSLNADIQGGMLNPVASLLAAAEAAVAAADQALAQQKAAANQSNALRARVPAMQKHIALPAILLLVEQLLPIVISAGGTLADLIKNLVNGSNAPGGTLTPADVASANAAMHAGLSNWKSAA